MRPRRKRGRNPPLAARGNRCETKSLLYFSFRHARKITTRDEAEEESQRSADGRARHAAYTLWAFHHTWLSGAGPTRGGSRAGSRQPEWKIRAACARSLTVPDRRRSDFAAVRLPRAA